MNNDTYSGPFGAGMSGQGRINDGLFAAGVDFDWLVKVSGESSARYVVESLRHELVQTARHQGLPLTDIVAIQASSPDEVVKAHIAALPHIKVWRRERAVYAAQVEAEHAAKRAVIWATVSKRRAKVKAASASRRAQRKAAK